jgi:hypothetical protein
MPCRSSKSASRAGTCRQGVTRTEPVRRATGGCPAPASSPSMGPYAIGSEVSRRDRAEHLSAAGPVKPRQSTSPRCLISAPRVQGVQPSAAGRLPLPADAIQPLELLEEQLGSGAPASKPPARPVFEIYCCTRRSKRNAMPAERPTRNRM